MKGRESKPHIGIFGRRNVGKSTLINSLTGQDTAIVSETAGTTTDPVKKSVEIDGIGPAILVDTAGIDDLGELGQKRIGKSLETIRRIDMALLVTAHNEIGEPEQKLVERFQKWEVPYLLVQNKSDLVTPDPALVEKLDSSGETALVSYSAIDPSNREELVEAMRQTIPETAYLTKSLVGDIIQQGDLVLLITPIDDEAPEGRLILPQVQAIRDILDNDAVAIVAKEREIDTLLSRLTPRPAMAICDSQVFLKAAGSVPEDIPLTSFSTVLARYKGDFENYLKGTPTIDTLKEGDRILILESCTHQVSCDDIGRVKIPRWLSQYTGKRLEFTTVAGLDAVPGNITDYSLVVQCGACMITRKQLINRLKPAVDAGVPVTNYGMTIAYIQGIYNRAIAPFTGENKNPSAYL